jgi:hypothetical protein
MDFSSSEFNEKRTKVLKLNNLFVLYLSEASFFAILYDIKIYKINFSSGDRDIVLYMQEIEFEPLLSYLSTLKMKFLAIH